MAGRDGRVLRPRRQAAGQSRRWFEVVRASDWRIGAADDVRNVAADAWRSGPASDQESESRTDAQPWRSARPMRQLRVSSRQPGRIAVLSSRLNRTAGIVTNAGRFHFARARCRTSTYYSDE